MRILRILRTHFFIKKKKFRFARLACARRIYAVQCLNRPQSTSFYRDMATLTDGFHLQMDQFASIINFMLAICYREQGDDQLQGFEEEVRERRAGLPDSRPVCYVEEEMREREGQGCQVLGQFVMSKKGQMSCFKVLHGTRFFQRERERERQGCQVGKGKVPTRPVCYVKKQASFASAAKL